MDEKHQESKSFVKEREECKDCAEYGSDFCDHCLEEMKNKLDEDSKSS